MKKIFMFCLLILLFKSTFAQDTASKRVISYDMCYVNDISSNHFGGLKIGTKILGKGNFGMGIDLYKMSISKLFKGVSIYANGSVTYGESFSENNVGDFQTVSNIDAGNHTYIHELWLKRSSQSFEIIVGLQDLNASLIVTENGGEFINSSFGVPSVISSNTPVPVFPLTALGITTSIKISDKISLLASAFDGAPTAFEDNPYNTKWEFKKDDGAFLSSEIHFKTKIKDHLSSYKLGLYYHSELFERSENHSSMIKVFDENYGLYGIVDQSLIEKNNNSLNAFFQISISPQKINNHNSYVGAGLVYSSKIIKHEDKVGLACANAFFARGIARNETVLELFYKTKITNNVMLFPDVQYVINPAGSNVGLKNSLISILRLEVNL